MLRVLTRRISTDDETFTEGDLIPADHFDNEVTSWLLATGRVEPVEDFDGPGPDPVDDDEPEQVACPDEGCGYSGTSRGLAMHTSRVHADDDTESEDA